LELNLNSVTGVGGRRNRNISKDIWEGVLFLSLLLLSLLQIFRPVSGEKALAQGVDRTSQHGLELRLDETGQGEGKASSPQDSSKAGM
jgi:hypothetical protein